MTQNERPAGGSARAASPEDYDDTDLLPVDETGMLSMKACSATDCTGLIPALPTSDAELESYAQVYHYPADIFQD